MATAARHVERPLIGIPTSENIAEQVLTNAIDLGDLGIDRNRLARSPDSARDVRAQVEVALSGGDAALTARCLATVNATDARISLEFLAILVHCEVNAAAWLVLKEHLDHILVPKGPGANVMSPDANARRNSEDINPHVHFGGGRYRLPGGILDLPAGSLPATIAVAAIGRPLAEIVSHPALDGMGHRITATAESDGILEIIYGDHHPTIALAEIHDGLMWPHPGAMGRIHHLARQLRETRSGDMIDDMTTPTA